MKILVFTTDTIPLEGLPTSGTALRTFGLIQGLRHQGHEVVVSVPSSALEGMKKANDIDSLPHALQEEIAELSKLTFDASNQNALLSEISPDVVICGHWPAMTLSTKPSQTLIIDLAGPHMLERHYQGSSNQIGATLGKLAAISNADYFIVSGEKQRLYFLSFLLRAGIPQPERKIIKVVMPLDPALPEPRSENSAEYPNFVFGGVFLPWQNPAVGLRAVRDAISKREQGKLTLIGGTHPNYKIKEGVYAKLFEELSEHPRVEIKPMLPYTEFKQALSKVDVAIDLMEWNLERELAVTIRSTTYLWAGVPVIYNDFADLAVLIKQYDAGWCVAPGDQNALDAVFEEIYSNPELIREKSRNARKLAEELFSWDRAVAPLLDFLVKPETKRLKETDVSYDFPDSADRSISAEKEIEQHFVCRINGLTRVECRLATHNRSIDQDIEIQLYEVQSASNGSVRHDAMTLLASETLAASELKNNDWHALDISPIPSSAGKTYALRISSNESQESKSVSPWTVKGSPYPLKGFYQSSKLVEHTSLCLRTTCAGAG